MNPDALHHAQVLAFWIMALALVALAIIHAIALFGLAEYVPEFLRILERGL